MSLPIIAAIVRKDVRSIRWLVLLVALLFLADPIIVRLELSGVWTTYSPPVILCALLVLVTAVFQLDSPASLADDWLCRPVPRRELLVAKLLLCVGAVYLPRAVGAFAADLVRGYPISECLLDAVLLQDDLSVFLLPFFLFTAIVTRTFVQAFGVLIATFIVVFVIPTPFVREPSPLSPGIRDSLLISGMQWVGSTPAYVAALVLVATGLWLVYGRRRLLAARVMLAVTLLVSLFLLVLPMALLPWHATLAIQSAVSPAPPATAAGITVRNTRACFPASRHADAHIDARLGQWDEDSLRGIGPDSVAFVTAVEARGLPPDWRVKLNYVEAQYLDGARVLYSLRPARYLTDVHGGESLSHAWLLPQGTLPRLREADARLRLTYSLTLLRPREYPLPTDGERHALPELGYCSARVDEPGDRIAVDCFLPGAHPAQVTAELDGIPASRSHARADFSPAALQWAHGEHVKLDIGSPRLAKHDTVILTAWETAGLIQRSLTTPGILGADADTCPLPATNRERFQASQWRDAAPHEVRSVGVGDDVQLEVLDFGGTGAPVLLLPGLGATAHSFDELAPQLARTHRAVAMTRRGAGASSRSDYGFDTPHLAQDVLRVMDAVQLGKALLVGHSIAGDELTWLGARHADRFRGLVYLDAAYDRSQDPAHGSRFRALDAALPPEPPIPTAAFASYESLSALLAQRGHLRLPQGELIAFWHANDPVLAGTPAIDARTRQAISAAIGPPDYAALRIPALAIYAIARPDEALPPWFDGDDATLKSRFAELNRILGEKQRRDIEAFEAQVAHGEVLELANARHYVFQSNPQEVLEAIEAFDAKLAR